MANTSFFPSSTSSPCTDDAVQARLFPMHWTQLWHLSISWKGKNSFGGTAEMNPTCSVSYHCHEGILVFMSTATVGFFSLQTACLSGPIYRLLAKVSSHLISVFSILQILTTHTPPSLLPRIPLYSCPYLVLPFILLAFSFYYHFSPHTLRRVSFLEEGLWKRSCLSIWASKGARSNLHIFW